MKKYKKATIFLALISLFYCVTLIQETYAKYITSATGTTNMTFAKWNIIINNQDIQNNSNFGNTIIPEFENNQNIKEGVLAPTSVGKFDIELDMTEVDVSVEYRISAEISKTNTVTDLKIISYEINGIEQPYIEEITNQILQTDTNKKVKITFKVEWVEGESETMNNEADTLAAKQGIASIDVKANFTQLK